MLEVGPMCKQGPVWLARHGHGPSSVPDKGNFASSLGSRMSLCRAIADSLMPLSGRII